MNRLTSPVVALALTIGSAAALAADDKMAPSTAPVPAGAYTLDKSHATLLFRVDHLGFSNYTARFTRFDSQLQFDPGNLAASSVKVTIDPRSIASDNAPDGFMDTLAGDTLLDAAKYPQMTFQSKKVERTGPKTLRIDGTFTLHGVTKPLSLNATYNGGYAGHPMDPHARIGFSAKGSLKRSDYGMPYGIPAPGTTMGVGDKVEIIVEAEFNGPSLATASAADAPAAAQAAKH